LPVVDGSRWCPYAGLPSLAQRRLGRADPRRGVPFQEIERVAAAPPGGQRRRNLRAIGLLPEVTRPVQVGDLEDLVQMGGQVAHDQGGHFGEVHQESAAPVAPARARSSSPAPRVPGSSGTTRRRAGTRAPGGGSLASGTGPWEAWGADGRVGAPGRLP
jgi:hypothetical protein